MIEADSDPSEPKMCAGTEYITNGLDQDRREESRVQADDSEDTMLTKREVADLLGVKSTNTVDNYRNDFEDFPEAVVYGANTLRWSKRKIERWKKARPAR
jgi:predicted DNA-binding transcriptional regulator AlpA